VQDASTAVDSFGGFEHLIGGGAGEDGAWAGGVKHSHSHKTAVHGFVAAASAGDKAYFSLHGGVGADDVIWIVEHLYDVRVSQLDTLKLLQNDILGLVN